MTPLIPKQMIRNILIGILGILLACSASQNNDQEIQEEFEPVQPNPNLTKSNYGNGFPEIFEAAYISDTILDYSDFEFFQNEIGNIKITSGKIVVGDPIVMHDLEAYDISFPIGEFPVQTAHANSLEGHVAYCRILFNSNPPEKWELARLPGQEFLGLKDSNFYCFGIDAGTGIILDAQANEYYNKNENVNTIWDNSEKNNYQPFIQEFDRFNLACFGTGGGDGCYASYVGYDSTNQICRLLLDFQFVDWWTE